MQLYAKLKEQWSLRGYSDTPRLLVNYINSDMHDLGQDEFYVAESCDGDTNFNSLAFLPKHRLILEKMIKNGIAEGCNRGDSIDEIQKYRKASNSRVTRILWCITGKCNLKCRHCCMDAPTSKYGELDFNDMVRLIGQFEKANVIQVGLSGGEPFCRNDLGHLIELLSQKRIGLHQIYTNGTLISEEILVLIKKHCFLPIFQISFDGKGTHDLMRGTTGIENLVVKNIKKIREFGFPIGIATSIDRTNIHSLEPTYHLLKNLGVQSWTINPPRTAGRWKNIDTALTIEEQIEPFEKLLRQWLEDEQPFYIQMAGFLFGLYGILESKLESMPHGETLKEPPDKSFDDYVCDSCRERPNLLPDATLLPCPVYVDTRIEEDMPNLLHEDLSMVWNSSEIRKILDVKRIDIINSNPECRACNWFNKCGGGCRALAVTETDNLTARDPITCHLWRNGYIEHFKNYAAQHIDSLKSANKPD